MSVRNIVLWIRDFFDDVAVPGSWAQLISITPQKATPAEAENANRFRRLLGSPIFLKWIWRILTVWIIWQTYEFLFKD
jgi:hypothetical protein